MRDRDAAELQQQSTAADDANHLGITRIYYESISRKKSIITNKRSKSCLLIEN